MKTVVKKSNIKMKSRLDMNISSGHEGEKTFDCEICGKIFTHKSRLTKHIGAIHEGKKPFKCDICSSGFARKSNLKAVHGRKKAF